MDPLHTQKNIFKNIIRSEEMKWCILIVGILQKEKKIPRNGYLSINLGDKNMTEEKR